MTKQSYKESKLNEEKKIIKEILEQSSFVLSFIVISQCAKIDAFSQNRLAK